MQHTPTLPYPERSEAFQSGASLNGFEVGPLLSQGAHTSVFACGTNMLLLVYHAGRGPDRALRQKLAARKSEHLCSVLRSGSAAGHEYDIVPKYQERQLDWRKLSPSQRQALIIEELRAIDALHQWGFCHLDIKPEHFLFDESGNVRLIDYGTAMPIHGSRTGIQFQFTPRYAAPEIIGGGYSTASDVYSYGILLRERERMLGSPTSEGISTMMARMTSANPGERLRIPEAIAALTKPQHRIKLLPVVDRGEMDRIVRSRRQRQRELRDQLIQELVTMAHRAEPALAARQFQSLAAIPGNPDQLEAAIQMIQAVPKATANANVTNITRSNVCAVLSALVITELPSKPRGRNFSTPEEFLPTGSFYIFRQSELAQWQQAQRELRQKRAKRAWKIVGSVALGMVVIAALPFIIGFALIVLVIGALLNLF